MPNIELTVVDHEGKTLGVAHSIGEAKRMHEEHYKTNDNRLYEAYAGLAGNYVSMGTAIPVFVQELL